MIFTSYFYVVIFWRLSLTNMYIEAQHVLSVMFWLKHYIVNIDYIGLSD